MPLIFENILGITRQVVAILFIEQPARQALTNARWGGVLETGRVRAQGLLREPQSGKRIQEAHLGGAGLGAR